MFETIFAASGKNETNEEVIRILVEQMGFLAGKSVQVEKQIVVSTDDINLSSALDALAESMKSNVTVGLKKPKKEKKPQEDALPIKMGKASWKNVKTGEVISTMKLHQALKESRAEVYTVYINAKGVRHVVMLNDLGGLDLVKEPEGV